MEDPMDSVGTGRTPSRRGCTIVGTDGPDIPAGTPGRDVICGRGVNDGIDFLSSRGGTPGNDVNYGGLGAGIFRADNGTP